MSEQNVEDILAHIGITRENVRHDAYNHWYKFIEFCKKNSGKDWKDDIRPKLRSWVGLDFKYIDDYQKSCLAWKILELNEGHQIFKGIPKSSETPFTEEINKMRKEKEKKQP